ncbi:MAG: pantetheine-phosphate adenylyltransferase [Rhodocyclaceae bacterium]|nr:pantetheine-phosphate adenylyltransferase [Rhodocyclaceae bacterium]MBX3667383.1 pantetheine-phosphate adenylyltransferase [Rhodocyclaceae bacterium]
MSDRVAVYSGTFDPVTRGHEDIIRRAAQLFERVIVGVAVSRAKQPFFTLEERIDLLREVLQPYPNVVVDGFAGLLVDFLDRHDARVIVRGLRAVSDFEYEFQMAGMNRRLRPDVETVFFTPEERYLFISATMVREIASMGGNVAQFVPPLVETKIQAKVLERQKQQ